VSSQGAAFSALVVAGALAVLPAAAFAQEPVAPADVSAQQVVAGDPAEAASCRPRAAEDTLAPEDQAEAEGPADTQPEPVPAPAPATSATAGDEPEHPVAYCSQNAGDNQYRDPFANSPPPGGGGGGAGSSQAEEPESSAGALTGTSTLQQDGTTATDPAATASSGPRLPNTGLGLGGLVALGLPLLAGGIALRARLA
jgi:hypothetical protein